MCLNRPKEALVMGKLLELSGISQKMDYKALCLKEINKSEKHLSKENDVLEHHSLQRGTKSHLKKHSPT